MEKEPYGCKDQLFMNKRIIENCGSKQKNQSIAWIDFKNAFDKKKTPMNWF